MVLAPATPPIPGAGLGGRARAHSLSSGDEASGEEEGGFTLLEVLVAFAILALMLVPILQIFGDSLGGTQRARMYADGAMLARSKLTEVSDADSLEEGETSGTFEGVPYRWRATVERDTSDVTLPDDTVVGLATAGSERRSRRGFGSSTSGFGSRSGFGSSSSSGFGSRSGRSSGFSLGGSNSSFGSGGTSAFGRSSSGANQSDDTATAASGEEVEGDDLEAQLIAFRITVTVAWGEGRSTREVSLSTERVGRETTRTGGGQ